MHSEEFTVHVANLNSQSTEPSILDYFSYFGDIRKVKMFYDRKGGRFNRGYCRLVISQKETYDKILSTPHRLDGHDLNCTQYVIGQTQHYSDPENNQKKVIFKGVQSILENQFEKFCSQFGTVMSLIHMQWLSQEPQTYLVVFAQVSDSEKVLKKKTFHFMGSIVTAEAFTQHSCISPLSLAQSKVVHPTSSRILTENESSIDSTTKHGKDKQICPNLQNGTDSSSISSRKKPNRDVPRESEPYSWDSGAEYQPWTCKDVPSCNSSLPKRPNPSFIKAGREAQGRESLMRPEDEVPSMGVSWRDRMIVSKPKPTESAHFKYLPLAGIDLRNREDNYRFTCEPPY